MLPMTAQSNPQVDCQRLRRTTGRSDLVPRPSAPRRTSSTLLNTTTVTTSLSRNPFPADSPTPIWLESLRMGVQGPRRRPSRRLQSTSPLPGISQNSAIANRVVVSDDTDTDELSVAKRRSFTKSPSPNLTSPNSYRSSETYSSILPRSSRNAPVEQVTR